LQVGGNNKMEVDFWESSLVKGLIYLPHCPSFSAACLEYSCSAKALAVILSHGVALLEFH
jgi:hypothetical protein